MPGWANSPYAQGKCSVRSGRGNNEASCKDRNRRCGRGGGRAGGGNHPQRHTELINLDCRRGAVGHRQCVGFCGWCKRDAGRDAECLRVSASRQQCSRQHSGRRRTFKSGPGTRPGPCPGGQRQARCPCPGARRARSGSRCSCSCGAGARRGRGPTYKGQLHCEAAKRCRPLRHRDRNRGAPAIHRCLDRLLREPCPVNGGLGPRVVRHPHEDHHQACRWSCPGQRSGLPGLRLGFARGLASGRLTPWPLLVPLP